MLLPDFVCCAICSCAALGRGRVAGGSRCLACICRCLAMAGLPCFLQCCATASPFCRLPARPVGIGLLLFCLCRSAPLPGFTCLCRWLPVGLTPKCKVVSGWQSAPAACAVAMQQALFVGTYGCANAQAPPTGEPLTVVSGWWGCSCPGACRTCSSVSAFASARALAFACGHCGGCGAALPAGRRHRACTLPCAGGVTASPSS